MKAILTLTIVVLCVASSLAQRKTVKLLSEKIGPISAEYLKIINLDEGDTSYLVFLAFQNAKYTAIVDSKYVSFNENELMQQFIKDLTGALVEMESKTSSMTWNRDSYSLTKTEVSKSLLLKDKNDSGYTFLNANQVTKLINWLKRVDIGKDEVKP